jgi:hypothetical protein
MSMTWEAFRLTSKSPSEVLHVLGPHGVDDLIRKAMDACWREYPEETRTFENVKKRVLEVFNRNLRVWSAIKKPTPQSFFENLLPYAADGHVRQAMVLTWMMMPRAGGRDFSDTKQIISHIFERNLQAWEEDHRTFSGAPKQKASARNPAAKKPAAKKPAAKKQRGKKTPAKRAAKTAAQPAKKVKPKKVTAKKRSR